MNALPQDALPLAVNDPHRVRAVAERPVEELLDRDRRFVGPHSSDVEFVAHSDGREVVIDASGRNGLVGRRAALYGSQPAHVQRETRVPHDHRRLPVRGFYGLHRAPYVEAPNSDDIAYPNRTSRFLRRRFDGGLLKFLGLRPRPFQLKSGPLDRLVVDPLAARHVPRQRRLRSSQLPASVLELRRQFRPHRRRHVLPPGPRVAKLGLQGFPSGLRLALGLLGLLEHRLELHSLPLKLVQPVLELHVLRFQQTGRLLHDPLRQSQPPRDGHGIAPPRHAHRQVVRRTQRVRFEIDARVHHSL